MSKMSKITSIQLISSIFTFHFWLFHFAPFYLQVLANDDISLDQDFIDSHHAELVSTFISSPFSREYTRRVSPYSSTSSNNNSPSVNSTKTNSSDSSILMNTIPRLPIWNDAPFNGDQQRQLDLTQLFELMGEPRGSRGRELSELITRPKPKCNRRIRVLNGVTRIRERGSLARFQCSHGFTLIGPTTIVCLRDRWSEPPPICVKSGCRPIRRPQRAEVRQSVGGAVVAFYCLGETTLLGDPILFCDGTRWNGTEPTCLPNPVLTTTPEAEQEENWPESVPTPNSGDFGVGKTDQDKSWDSNLQPLISETTTEQQPAITGIPEIGHTTELVVKNQDDTRGNVPIIEPNLYSTEPLPSIIDVQKTTESATEAGVPTEFPTDEKKTEKHPEVPAPVTTEKPIILTQEMGHYETPPFLITSAAEVPVATSSIPTQLIHQISLITSPLAQPQPPLFINPVVSTTQNTAEAFSPFVPISTTKISTAPTTIPPRPTPRRRFKIITKRPRRPQLRPSKRPLRRTTTGKPRKPKKPTFLLTSPLPPPFSPMQTFSTSIPQPLVPKSVQDGQLRFQGPTVDYPVAIDKEFLPREQVEPIRPIIFPDMLNNNIYPRGDSGSNDVGHASMIIGIVLVVVGLTTFSAGAMLYCWRKNKGIARARPYDMDGRTLSAHDANDDFTWVDQRDSGL